MSYRFEKTPDGNQDLVIEGFERGIAASPHDGIANMQGVNISTENQEAMCSFNRVVQIVSSSGVSGTLTPLTHSTVSFSPSISAGTWFTITADSGTGLSGSYYYLGSNQIATTLNGTAISNIILNTTTTVVFLTSGTTWTVPADFDPTHNTVEVIGGGGGGGATSSNGAPTFAGGGGGGGAYSKTTNVALTPGGTAAYVIGAAGVGGVGVNNSGTDGGDTYFNGASLGASSVGAKGGTAGTNSLGGAGGASSGGVGSTKFSGGTGGDNGATNNQSGAGGGAAGPSGAGGAGSAGTGTGVGGTADNGTVAGGTAGTNGNNGTEWDGTHGSGSGAGGASNAQNGLTGGRYGGGGSGAGGGTTKNGGAGFQGVIRITYTPTTATTSATFSTIVMGEPVMSATERYVDTSNVTQYRYFILDKLGQVWVHDTAITSPVWFLAFPTSLGAGQTASGLAVLNGWLSVMYDTTINWIPTCALGTVPVSGFTQATSNSFHATLVGHASTLYYTDGNYVGSIFPNTTLPANGPAVNIQSYGEFTASISDGITCTVTALLSGTYPLVPGGSTQRIPVTFLSTGSLPGSITAGANYWIQWLFSGLTFQVYAAATGGAQLNMVTGATGNLFFNTFNAGSSSGTATATVTPQRLNLPASEIGQSLAEIGISVLVGGIGNTIYSWDQVAANPNAFIPLPENNIANIISVNNMGYVFCGQKGNIYITNGSTASIVTTVPDYAAGIAGTPASYIEPYFSWGGGMYLRGRIWFSILDQTASKTGNCGGIWSFVPSNNTYSGQDNGIALRLENKSSYGTLNGYAPVLLPSQQQLFIGPQFWSGWKSSITTPTYGIDFSDTITTPAAIIETDLIPTGTMLEKKTFTQIEYKLNAPLAAGETVSISYRQNATDSYTALTGLKTESSTNISGYYQANFQKGQWLQLKVTLTPLASSSSSFVRLKQIRIR